MRAGRGRVERHGRVFCCVFVSSVGLGACWSYELKCDARGACPSGFACNPERGVCLAEAVSVAQLSGSGGDDGLAHDDAASGAGAGNGPSVPPAPEPEAEIAEPSPDAMPPQPSVPEPCGGRGQVCCNGAFEARAGPRGLVPACEQGLGCDSVSAQCEACASFRGLGFYPGHTGSSAKAISADGTVAVGSGSGPGTAQLPLRWVLSEAGPPQVLGTLVGGTGGFPEALSADGAAVVGWANTSDSFSNIFLWTLGGSLERLDYGAAYGVSADGARLVGTVSNTNEAFRWTRLNGFTGLGFLPGGQESRAYAISGDGSTVVGGAQRADTIRVAFRWTGDAGMEDLGTLPEDTSSTAYAASSDGSIVVGVSDGASGSRAFRWSSADGVMRELFAGWALSTNASGSIVVGQRVNAGGVSAVAMWDEASPSVRTLSEVLGELIPSGWSLDTYGSISADGKVVVGSGSHPGSVSEGWVAVLGPDCRPSPPLGPGTVTVVDAGP